MGHAKSGNSIYSRRSWQKRMKTEMTGRDECGHVWEWDPDDRLMRCYKCGAARLQTDADRLMPRVENGPTDF